MANNVLINFTADTGGLDEANRKLEELKKREQELIAEVEKLRREQQAANLSTNDSNRRIQNEREYARRIQETRTQLTQTRRDIDRVNEAQRNLNQTITRGAAQETFRSLRRELTEQLRQLQLNGQAGSEAYQRIRDQLVQLNVAQREVNAQIQQQSSVAYTFDTIVKGTQLAAGGYSVLTGAMGLFGEKNQDVQMMMMKLQSTIAMTTGVQSVYNAVVGEGNIITRISALQIRAKALAESLATKNTIAATVAQKIFNLVAMANPYVLLAMAIITVVGALYIFSRNTENVIEKQKKLNDLVKESIDLKDKYAEELKIRGEENIKALQREYDLMKARGASEAQLALKQRQIDQERIKNANEIVDRYKDEIDSIERNKIAVDKYTEGLSNMNKALYEAQKKGLSKTTFKFDGQVQKIDINEKAIEATREKLQRGLEIATLRLDQGRKAQQEQRDALDQEQKNTAEANKKAAEAGRRSAVAMAEYKVLIAKKGTEEELAAQIAAIKVKRDADLANINLTKGERLKLAKEADIQIEKLQNDSSKSRLENEKAMIEAGLALAEEGSLERYNFQTQLLSKQREIELNQLNLTEEQKLLIQNNYLAKLKKATDDYFNNLYQQQIETDISLINEKLAKVKSGSQEEYSLRTELAEANARLEKEDVENTIKNEELKAARIKEINAQLAKEKREILSEQDSSNIQKQADREELIISQQYANGKISKRAYENELNKITIDSLNKQIENRLKYGEDTIDLEQELADKRIEIAQQEAEARAAIQEELFNTISTLATLSFDNQKAQIQQQLADLDHYYTTDAEKAKENTNLKLISQEEYDRRQLELKRKQAQAEKNQAIFNLVLTNGQAIARAFKDFPFPYSAIVAALVGVQTIAQLNNIRSQPLPKYWKGRKSGQGEFALVGEHGAELMYVPSGASIMPAHDSLRALNGDYSVMSKWNMPAINPSYPVVPNISQQLITDARSSYNAEIDYDKVGRAVAKYQRKPVERPVYVSVDRSGTTVTDGNTKTKYLNTKFKNVM